MIDGIILGFIIGLLGLCWLFLAFLDISWKKIILLMLSTMIIPTIIGGAIGKYEDNIEYLQYIEGYKTKKKLYEDEIQNKTFEEIEKMGIFSSIVSSNSELSQKKIYYKKWYYFFVDYSLIENLEPIKMSKGK